MKSALPLEGSVAVISGGLGDIGHATAVYLRELGATVALGDRLPPDEAGERAKGFHYLAVEVSDEAGVEKWIGQVQRDLGTPTLAVLNAGIVTTGAASEIKTQDWKQTLDVNLSGALYVAQAVVRRMKAESLPGSLVFVGSWAAHAPHSNLAAYSVSKAGLRMLAQCFALELAGLGIRVNEIAPGYVNAGLSRQLFEADPALEARCAEGVPNQKMITPSEVARQIGWLCDPANRHLVGSVLLMDGGLSLLQGPSGKA